MKIKKFNIKMKKSRKRIINCNNNQMNLMKYKILIYKNQINYKNLIININMIIIY